MARLSDSEISRLKTETSLVRLIEKSGLTLTKSGKDRVGHCPFHDDKTPSLVVSPDKNLWHCMGACGDGGDVIAWVMKAEGVSFRHACELLMNAYDPGGKVTKGKAGGAATQSRTQKLGGLFDAGLEEPDAVLLKRVVAYYHETLKQSPEALNYLKRRDLAHPELIDTFRLGFANRTLGYRLPPKSNAAGKQVRGRLEEIGIYRDSGHEHLAGSLVVPVFNTHGQVVQVYGRKLLDNLRKGTPKHLYLPRPLSAKADKTKMAGIFNAPAVTASDEIILCEALIDAMTFWVAGYRHVTASFGTNGFTDELLDAMAGRGVKRVLIAYDRDEAGDNAAIKLAPRLTHHGIDVYRVLFPRGQDANDYARNVRPANKSLGALLRGAELMAMGQNKTVKEVLETPLTEEIPDPVAEAIAPEPPTDDPVPPVVPAVVPAMMASPAPAVVDGGGPTVADDGMTVSEHEVIFKFEDRAWRVRGLAKNMSFETLRVNLLVRRDDAFHVDGIDLYNAKHRASFLAQAAGELALPPDILKRDIGRVLLKLETLQDDQISQTLNPAQAVAVMEKEDRQAAMKLLQSPDLLDRIVKDAEACGIVGERANVLAAYLAGVSRKLDQPLAIIIQSTSAAGKSALMDAVLAMMPEEECVQYSAMTGQSLYYLGESDIRHKVLAIAEEEGVREASYALKLLQSQGALTIASTGKDALTGKLVTQEYKVQGPVTLMLTTTAIDLDEELRNRCLVLSVNESREQTREIHRRQRYGETLEGLIADERREALLGVHQNAQRLLRSLKVVNPYAEQLTFLDEKTRTRRDHKKYLALIRAIALLHQHSREIKTLREQAHEPIEYIEATLDDIAAANALAHGVMGRTLDELPPQTRTLLDMIEEMVKTRAEDKQVRPSSIRFTRREIRAACGWGDTQTKVHCRRLVELEYLILHRGEHARQYRYDLAYDGEGHDGNPFLMGLIDVKALKAGTKTVSMSGLAGTKPGRSGVMTQWAEDGRATVGLKSGGGCCNDLSGNPDSIALFLKRPANINKPHSTGKNREDASYIKRRAIG